MTLYGTITDKDSGETLPNANIYFSDAGGRMTNNQGSTSNLNGEYSISGEGDYVTASYTGHVKQVVKLNGQNEIDFQLKAGINLPEVVITGKRMWPVILSLLLALLGIWLLFKTAKK